MRKIQLPIGGAIFILFGGHSAQVQFSSLRLHLLHCGLRCQWQPCVLTVLRVLHWRVLWKVGFCAGHQRVLSKPGKLSYWGSLWVLVLRFSFPWRQLPQPGGKLVLTRPRLCDHFFAQGLLPHTVDSFDDKALFCIVFSCPPAEFSKCFLFCFVKCTYQFCSLTTKWRSTEVSWQVSNPLEGTLGCLLPVLIFLRILIIKYSWKTCSCF